MHHQFLSLLPILASIASAASTTQDDSVQKAHNVLMDAIDKQESKLALQAFVKASSIHADHDAIKPLPATSPAAKKVFLQAKIVQANDLAAFGPISYAILDEAKVKEDLVPIGPEARVKQVKAQLEAAWMDLTKERSGLMRRSGEVAAAAEVLKAGVESVVHAAGSSGSAAVRAAEENVAKAAAGSIAKAASEAGEHVAPETVAAAKPEIEVTAPETAAAAKPQIEPATPEAGAAPKPTEDKPKGLIAKWNAQIKKWNEQLKERTAGYKKKVQDWMAKGEEARANKKAEKAAKKAQKKADKAAKKEGAATGATEAQPTFKQNFVNFFKAPRVQIATAVLGLAAVGIVLYDIFKPVKAPSIELDNMDGMMTDTDGLTDDA
jgi:hypothetical protein